MTSSCTSAQACSSSSAENNSRRVVADRGVGLGGHRPVAPVGEGGAHTLAAAQDEVLEGGDQPVVVGADVGGVRRGGPPGIPAVDR